MVTHMKNTQTEQAHEWYREGYARMSERLAEIGSEEEFDALAAEARKAAATSASLRIDVIVSGELAALDHYRDER